MDVFCVVHLSSCDGGVGGTKWFLRYIPAFDWAYTDGSLLLLARVGSGSGSEARTIVALTLCEGNP